MSKVLHGLPPPPDEPGRKRYLLRKLEEARKDCQWILGLGAAGVLGVVIKDGFGSSTPGWRMALILASVAQIFLSMCGALAWWSEEIDKAQVVPALMQRLRVRYLLRNISVTLLAASFILIAVLGWFTAPGPKG